jgi:hypothetical protein
MEELADQLVQRWRHDSGDRSEAGVTFAVAEGDVVELQPEIRVNGWP